MLRALDRSIRLKLLMVVTVTTFSALLLTAAVLVTYEIRSYETSAINDLLTQAELVGRSSTAALQFDDPVSAKQNLDLLRVRPRIAAAVIYRADGHPFATYRRDAAGDTTLPALPTFVGPRVAGDRIELFQPITDADGRIGTVYLRATIGLGARLRAYLVIVGLALAMSLALALVMSSWLQRSVTEPILAVSRVAHDVKRRRDLSLRAPKLTEDEIGDLVDTFNDMIDEVGRRTGALEQANRTLEREMAVRHEAEQALRAADQRKDEFLATLAHELRNPLAPLRNGLEILRGPAQPDDALTNSTMQIMDRQLRQLVRLVDDLLDVSRITTGKLTLRKEDADLAAVVQNALDAARPLVEARGLRLVVHLPEQPVMLCVDTTRIAQVLLNLLHNATKFTERGGTITLEAEADAATVTVRVSDTGIGIPAAQLPQVFDMFAQLDHSLERTTSGLGVGLSLSRRLVELHGGTLEAASEGASHGSTFTMRLPRELSGIAAPAESVPAAAAAHRRILLVDDNADFVESFALLLERMGHEVRLAHDGEEALVAAREFAPDVAFLDIGLPKINGYDLARRLRTEVGGAVTLVAVTGWGQDSDKQRAREAGFDHHMTKPVDLDQVGRLLAASRPAARQPIGPDGEMA